MNGFALARPGRLATQIGPVIAADEDAAAMLLSTALDAVGGPVFLDLADRWSGSPASFSSAVSRCSGRTCAWECGVIRRLATWRARSSLRVPSSADRRARGAELYVPVGRCSAVRVRCAVTQRERLAAPRANARSAGGHVVGKPRKYEMRWVCSVKGRS